MTVDSDGPASWAGGQRLLLTPLTAVLVTLALLTAALAGHEALETIGCEYQLAREGHGEKSFTGLTLPEARARLPSCAVFIVHGDDAPGSIVLDARLNIGTPDSPIEVLVGDPRFEGRAALPAAYRTGPLSSRTVRTAPITSFSSCVGEDSSIGRPVDVCVVTQLGPEPPAGRCEPLEVAPGSALMHRCTRDRSELYP